MLESFSFEVTLAASGQAGLTELKKASESQPFELVVMDWKMPGMDGIEASRRIKNHKGLRKIPAIIMVTAYGREEVVQQAEVAGLEGFLLKPVSPSMLFDAIMQAFGKAPPETSRVVQRKEQEARVLENIQGARVLLVEDNEINQQVAKEILEGAGLHVILANNGREAVNAVQEDHYDVVLMDVQMPVMDGYTATRKIRELHLKAQSSKLKKTEPKDRKEGPARSPQSSELPIIAMTAHAMAGDEQKSLEAGMNDHVTKPIDPDQLFATLQKWIKPVAGRSAVQKVPVPHAPAKSDQVVPLEEDLPESLPGFDVAAGLSRLRGNKRLYRKLLLDFGGNYGAVAGEIRKALAARNFNQTHSLVHNLKGLAGNLEATELQAAAVALEKLVKGQAAESAADEELNRKLTDLESALKRALDAVQTLGPMAKKEAIESIGYESSLLPPELAQRVADRITAAAEMGDVMQIASVAEELKRENDVLAPFCDQITQLSEDFDLEGILKLASELKSCK
jgi:CheY-like chemotaxis protein